LLADSVSHTRISFELCSEIKCMTSIRKTLQTHVQQTQSLIYGIYFKTIVLTNIVSTAMGVFLTICYKLKLKVLQFGIETCLTFVRYIHDTVCLWGFNYVCSWIIVYFLYILHIWLDLRKGVFHTHPVYKLWRFITLD